MNNALDADSKRNFKNMNADVQQYENIESLWVCQTIPMLWDNTGSGYSIVKRTNQTE